MKVYEGHRPDETITTLVLPIKAEWYDMIRDGIKKEEYREIKPYWTKRFQTIGALDKDGNPTGQKCGMSFKNGYNSDARKMYVWTQLEIGEGKKEWGAKEGQTYYILKIITFVELAH